MTDDTADLMVAARPESRRTVVTTFRETRTAVLEVAARAKRWISIITPDLEPGIYDSDAFIDIAKKLVLQKRFARVRVLISEPERTSRIGSSLVAVGRRLDTYIEFRNVHEKFRPYREAFILADNQALVYRVDHSRWEGIADTYEPAVAQHYLTHFEEIWQASNYSKELRQLRV
jgi:hypothetical protein